MSRLLARGRGRSGLEVAVCVFAVLALLTPFRRVEVHGRLGLLLAMTAVLEFAHGFRRSTAVGQRSAWQSGAITFFMGILLINAPNFAASALVLFLAGWFGLDGIRNLFRVVRGSDSRQSMAMVIILVVGNLSIAALLLIVRGPMTAWALVIASCLRILGAATNMAQAEVFSARDSGGSVLEGLDLADEPELMSLANRIAAEETARSAIDRGWIIGFIVTLFAIHIGRMGFDRTFLGIFSPGFAVLGDLCVALLFAFVVVVPGSILFRNLTRGLERRTWRWLLASAEGAQGRLRRLVRFALTGRLRRMIRLAQARYSFRTALSRGLQIGLPMAAVIAATVPVWGMSWYFDTENWASGVWNSWAEERTDDWRVAMIAANEPLERGKPPDRVFAVEPGGINPGEDFSFVVIGDTGEGDASQHSLRAQLLDVVRRSEVKFVVISSDVVYPTGAMRDYENKFWLPFMGTTKPVYAIPGNHDWYDALDGFVATFFEPSAARTAMRARVAADKGISSTTDAHIERLIADATRCRNEYRVPTQSQRAPFFQFQTANFALFAVDTGVAKSLDPLQMAWFKKALEAARGKTKMAVLGHPIYAGGHYQAADNPEFAAIHQLLVEHEVAIVMAGDTHDLEYYVERKKVGVGQALHFVNGGGGAYLSFGTALDWPIEPATADWAYYPSKAQVVGKIVATTPRWKLPAWWWTNRFGAWPFSPEWLSAAFDVNTAPFFQSFLEVRVESSKQRIRLIPYGIHGRLRWQDLDAAAGAVPAGSSKGALVEWEAPLAR